MNSGNQQDHGKGARVRGPKGAAWRVAMEPIGNWQFEIPSAFLSSKLSPKEELTNSGNQRNERNGAGVRAEKKLRGGLRDDQLAIGNWQLEMRSPFLSS